MKLLEVAHVLSDPFDAGDIHQGSCEAPVLRPTPPEEAKALDLVILIPCGDPVRNPLFDTAICLCQRVSLSSLGG